LRVNLDKDALESCDCALTLKLNLANIIKVIVKILSTNFKIVG
jgi:hypothetical protein